jgi:hypothetical protein
VDEQDGEVRMSLGDAAVAPFERAAQPRSFPVYKGQRNYPGLYSVNWQTSAPASF